MISEFRGKHWFLSNFYPEDEDGFTNEHRFQALKAEDVTERLHVLMAETPGEAKRLGRKVTLRRDWEDVKLDVMETTLRIKFVDPELRQKLIDTGDEKLVEGNNWGDRFWGACWMPISKVNAPIWERRNPPMEALAGFNHLGHLLMKLREEYRNA